MIALIRDSGVRLTQVNLLPYHRVGADKNIRLGRADCREFEPPAAEKMEQLKNRWQGAGISPVFIGG